MGTIASTTSTTPITWPSLPAIHRSHFAPTAVQYALVKNSSGNYEARQTTDAGANWTSISSFTRANVQEWSSFVVDPTEHGHLAYRVSESSTDAIYYRRVNLSTGVWTSEVIASGLDANGGSNGSVWQGCDLAVTRNADGSYAIAIAGARTETTVRYGIIVMGISITPDGIIYQNNGIITQNRQWLTTGTAPGRSTPRCVVEHNGDGWSSTTPNVWIAWGRTAVRMVKLSWGGSSVGWIGPSGVTNFLVLKTPVPAQDYLAAGWDGVRFSIATIDQDTNTTVSVYERNQANTSTTKITTPVHTTGVIRHISMSYDTNKKDLRIYAVGTSTAVVYFIDYVRATSSWTTWASVVGTAALGATGQYFASTTSGSFFNSKHHVAIAHSGAPNTVVSYAQTLTYVPNIPTWNTSSQPYTNGGAADVAASLVLDWDFSDPDPSDTQSAYALSRQIGAGALSYWRASDSTWQVAEVKNTSATSQVTLASSWGAGTDANYQFKVKVWDAADTVSAAYSSALTIIPSVKVNPSITAPTAAQVLNTNSVTVTWTASEQTAYRIRLLTNPGGVQVYDSGYIDSTDLSFTVPYELANGTGWTVELTTKNNERLASTAQTRNFTVAYASPPASLPTSTGVPASGWIQVVASSLAAVGVQPAISSMELWRRPKLYSNLTSNPSMAGNVTGYTGVGTTSMTYSTSQFHDSPGSARAVPTGVAGTSLVRHTALTDVTTGATYYASGWIRPDTSNKPVIIQLDWYTAASAFISSTTVQVTAVGTAWMFLEVTGDPSQVATAAKVTMSIGENGTPAAGDAFYADELKLFIRDATTGVRLVTGLAANATYNDWQATGGTDYEYRWINYSTTGTQINSPWNG